MLLEMEVHMCVITAIHPTLGAYNCVYGLYTVDCSQGGNVFCSVRTCIHYTMKYHKELCVQLPNNGRAFVTASLINKEHFAVELFK